MSVAVHSLCASSSSEEDVKGVKSAQREHLNTQKKKKKKKPKQPPPSSFTLSFVPAFE